MLDEEPTHGGLVKFHTAHKLTREAGTRGPASRHGPQSEALHRAGPAGRRGRLVADAGKRDWDQLTAAYGAMLMEGLAVLSYRSRHVNVLKHLMGYLKNHLSSEDKAYRR